MTTTLINSSAGVYTDVKDDSGFSSSEYQISKGVIVLFSEIGPVDQIVRITNGPAEFIQKFGLSNINLGYGHACALASLKYMQELLVTRVHNNAKFGGLAVSLTTARTLVLKQFTKGKMVDPTDPNLFYYDASDADLDIEKDLFYVYGSDPNNYNGNYRIAITDIKGPTDRSNPNTFVLKVYSKTASASAKPLETFTVSCSEQTDGLGRQQYIESVINGKSNYIRVLVNENAITDLLPSMAPSSGINYLGTDITAMAALSAGDSGLTDGNGNAINSSLIPTILNGVDAFPAAIVDAPVATKTSGWALYLDREEVEFDLMINGGYTQASVQRNMLSIADSRGDCFVILDMPIDQQGSKYDPTTAPVEYRDNTLDADTPNGAIYTPWLEVYDPYSGKNVIIPPSGHIAASYCYTDINYKQWFSPAGLNRGLLENLDPNFIAANVRYKQAARNTLDNNQINFTRNIENIGTAIWNDSTLQRKKSAESYISVVRLLKYCVRGINRELLYKVFDPNDSDLRADIIAALEAILEPIAQNRGLTKYVVICAGPGESNSNNTNDDIMNGILNVDIYLWPTIPAKRIAVRLYVEKSGATISAIS